jgi:hypothetical protein
MGAVQQLRPAGAQERDVPHVLFAVRLVPLIALAIFGSAVAFAANDDLPLVGSRTIAPQGELIRPAGDAADEPVPPVHDELGALSSSDGAGNRESDRRKRSGGNADEEGAEVFAALISNGGADAGGPAAPCAGSCVGHIEPIVPDVRRRVADLPLIRECKSSIGGDALCFDFGGGHYLVGDSPEDGQAELGFCASSGYYYVSGPELDGGARTACPDDRAAAEGGDPPRTRECASSTGGEATCFKFGGGRYIVSDPFDDGEGELGFCTPSGYYFVAAPSGRGGTAAECPDTATRD